MRNTEFIEGEYYHVYNRGNNKQLIFRDRRDRVRFLILMLYMQAPGEIYHIDRRVNKYLKSGVFGFQDKTVYQVVRDRYVELVAFCLMPNHFHLILKEREEGGISKYMHRVGTAYSKYMNKKYENVIGHLFQGPYKARLLDGQDDLFYLSAYVHRNPREIKSWRHSAVNYPWSSYQDYAKENRWDDLLVPGPVLSQCKSGKEYLSDVEDSGAKELSKYEE